MGAKSLEGKIAVVTCAAHGIGRAATVALAQEGATIIGFVKSAAVEFGPYLAI